MAAEPFDLEHGPLLRICLLHVRPQDYRLVVVVDHIVADGMSLGILWREIEALYRIFHARGVAVSPPEREAARETATLLPPARQYSSCVEAQARWLETPAFARQLKYWTSHLAGAAACSLPVDRPRPPVRSYRGDLAVIELPAALTASLSELSARHDVSLFASLLAGLDVLLARSSGQSDVVVMTPVACRQRFAAEAVIGYVANIVVLRTEVPARLRFDELIQRVNKEIMDGVCRRDVPFQKVIEALRPERSLSHDHLAGVALTFLPPHACALDLPGVEASYREIPNGGAKFDLSLIVAERADHLTVSAEYNSDIFDAATIHAFLEHYRLLLEAASAAPSMPAFDVPLLTAEERRLLELWNDTARTYPEGATLHELVAAQAARAPMAVALRFEGRDVRYGELDRRANQLAHALRKRGVGPDTVVGVLMERSVEMVVALLGVLKAGGAYIPLDAEYPRDRLAFMLDDARPPVILIQARLASLLPEHGGAVLRVDAEWEAIASEPNDAPPRDGLTPRNLAYVIYTSGSTGRPKGAMNEHLGICNRLTWGQRAFGLTDADRVLQKTPYSFDVSVWEIFWPLTVGATLVIARPQGHRDPAYLAQLIADEGITTVHFVPSMLAVFLDAVGRPGSGDVCGSLRRVVCSGETLPASIADRFFERFPSGVALDNLYGPTEAGIEVTSWACTRGAALVPIGRPIDNVTLHIVDERLAPVPIGVAGELCIGGVQVGRGYLNRPELTRERFIPDPFRLASDAEARLYKTGDRARWLPSGVIEYLGRADFQVKIRGFRIELGEIEATLAEHPAIRDAAVIAWRDSSGDQRLVAYVTIRAGATSPAPAELRAHLGAKLPDYMLPSRFIFLDALPLNASSKIDKKSLPPPSHVAATQAAADSEDAIPRGALELRLRSIWEDVLGVRGIDVNDNFFELGGHSLLALKLFARIFCVFGVNLPIASLFQAPTIAGLSQLLRQRGWAPSWSSLVPIQTAGTRCPLFCVHAIGGNVLNYRLLSKYLGDQQPVYGIQARGLGGDEAPHATVEEMAGAYIHEMRQEQPRGPYQICGSSSGGVIAFEMAQQLRAAGERVSTLVMLDTYRVGPPPHPVVKALASSSLHSLVMRFDLHFGQLVVRTPREGLTYLADRLRGRVHGTAGLAAVIKAATPVVRRVIEAHQRALTAYVPRPYPGSVVMLLSRDMPNRASYDERLAWADLLEQGLTLRFAPGTHQTLLDEPHVHEVAVIIGRCLNR
jgi:amino acid adenylation domain-containing protein